MLIDNLIKQGYLKTPRIIDAFRKIKRKDFVLEEFKDQAEGNYPLSIGQGQTISQPLTVAFMLELLQPEPGDKVLDVGSGSGWVTALLAEIVSIPSMASPGAFAPQSGQVYAIERIPELKEMGEKNVKKYNFIMASPGAPASGIVQFFCGDGTKGLLKYVPFDKIHVAAAAEEVPQALKDQLAINGRMVIPIRDGILKLDRKSKTEFKQEFFPGFVFVPLIEE